MTFNKTPALFVTVGGQNVPSARFHLAVKQTNLPLMWPPAQTTQSPTNSGATKQLPRIPGEEAAALQHPLKPGGFRVVVQCF